LARELAKSVVGSFAIKRDLIAKTVQAETLLYTLFQAKDPIKSKVSGY